MKPAGDHRVGQPALDLLEQAVVLVRGATVATWAVHAAGSLPFALGLLWFWAEMSRGVDAERHVAGASVAMALLFAWWRVCQSVFALRLRAQLADVPPPALPVTGLLRLAAVQMPLQATGLIVIPLTSLPLLMLPTPWVIAFYQSLAVLPVPADGTVRSAFGTALRQAARWPGQNHALIGMLMPLALTVWINVAIALAAGPWLLQVLLGVETDFVISISAFFNTTFLAAVTVFSGVLIDPVVKAVYVLRCFHADSLASGEDLRVELRRCRPAVGLATLILVTAVSTGAAPRLRADPAPVPTAIESLPGTIAPADLDNAIQRVLDRPEYRWRSPRSASAPEVAPRNWRERLSRGLRDTVAWMQRHMGSAMRSLQRWIRKMLSLPSGPNLPQGNQSADWTSGLTLAAYAALTVLLLAAAGYAWRQWHRRRSGTAVTGAAAPQDGGTPDLLSEQVQASELPEDEWLALASRLAGEGDWRRALRATHLAVLAHLAGREWVRLARHKTNRDYARELARRARNHPAVPPAFLAANRTFERAWYGDHPAGPDQVEEVRAQLDAVRGGARP